MSAVLRLPSSEAYELATPEQREQIDKALALIDERLAARREERDRRKTQSNFDGIDRRQQDRRER